MRTHAGGAGDDEGGERGEGIEERGELHGCDVE